MRLVTAAHGIPNCPFGGAVRHLPHPSRVIRHDACGPVEGLASAPPRNPGDECRAFDFTWAPNGRSQRPLPSTLRAAHHVRWGADPRRRRVLGGVVPIIEPSNGTRWAVRADPRPVIGVVGITANERDPAHAKPARAAALLAVQQYHPSSRPESMQTQAKSSRGGARTPPTLAAKYTPRLEAPAGHSVRVPRTTTVLSRCLTSATALKGRTRRRVAR